MPSVRSRAQSLPFLESMAKCLARFGSVAVIGLGGSTSPGVSLPRLSIPSLSPQLDHFLSAQRELRELFWSFEQATLASGLFFGRRRWISKAVDLDASKAENRCASGRATFALPSGLNKPASERAAHRRGRNTRNDTAGGGLKPPAG